MTYFQTYCSAATAGDMTAASLDEALANVAKFQIKTELRQSGFTKILTVVTTYQPLTEVYETASYVDYGSSHEWDNLTLSTSDRVTSLKDHALLVEKFQLYGWTVVEC
jgi:hypothetical protein